MIFKSPQRKSLPSRERGLKCYVSSQISEISCVAPFAGAWIEISTCDRICLTNGSLPSRERGLKYYLLVEDLDRILSLPSRERGLKCIDCLYQCPDTESLPSRERGLKWFERHWFVAGDKGRSLRGSVD